MHTSIHYRECSYHADEYAVSPFHIITND